MQEAREQQPAPALDVRHLSYSYGTALALKGITFSVAAGSVHAFIGPNGAGKTTTLKVLAAVLKPHWGTARVFGHDVHAEAGPVRRRIGYMPDVCGLYRRMTLFESLDFFAAAHGVPSQRRDTLIGELLALTEMEAHARDPLIGLSRGMLQRASLACTLVHDPDLLLLDEPAGGLDPRARTELMGILRALSGMGKTIFISSHILGELADLCDAVTVIDRGWTRYSGSMAALLASGGNPGYELVLAAEHPGVEGLLRGLPGVGRVSREEGRPLFRFSVDAARTDASAVLAAVLAGGGRVSSFRESGRGLDRAFMELTQPGVP